MTSSKRVYISSAEDEVIPFALDDLLNREVDQRFEEAAWRLAGEDVVFEPLAIKTLSSEQLERLNRGEPWEIAVDEPECLETSHPLPEDEITIELDVETGASDPGSEESAAVPVTEPDPGWLESQLAMARAETEVSLRVEYDAKIAELEQALNAKDTERAQAIEETEARLREEAAREMADAKQALVELTARVTEASQQVGQFFEPLSRLAIHVASQLVRGELTLSSTAIARLVQGCLDHLEGQIPLKPPVLRLHPDDLAQYLSTLGGSLEGLEVRADPSLARGDVSIQMNDSAIEDLIQHRLDQLVAVIFGTQQPWAQSMFAEGVADEASVWPAEVAPGWVSDEDATIVDWQSVETVSDPSTVEYGDGVSESHQAEDLANPLSDEDASDDALDPRP
ncbi:MAG: FliH/SctL family protein [Litorivicinaceae bacterium]